MSMSTVALREPTKSSARPIQGTWDWLSLAATRTQESGDTVTANELDADLHIETTTIMFADVVESVPRRGSRFHVRFGVFGSHAVPPPFACTHGT